MIGVSNGVNGVLQGCEGTLRTLRGEVWEAQMEECSTHKQGHLLATCSQGRGMAALKGGRQGFRCRERARAEGNGNTMGA